MTTTVIEQFLGLIEEDDEGWAFDLTVHAVAIGIPAREIPEAVVAWAWACDPTDTHFDAVEGTPDEAAWRWAYEGDGSKWNDPRYLRERFPHAFKEASA
tara:strand:- start:110 stop:406 length:297 start_codon:yes stop_codon:yes gene_type:complete